MNCIRIQRLRGALKGCYWCQNKHRRSLVYVQTRLTRWHLQFYEGMTVQHGTWKCLCPGHQKCDTKKAYAYLSTYLYRDFSVGSYIVSILVWCQCTEQTNCSHFKTHISGTPTRWTACGSAIYMINVNRWAQGMFPSGQFHPSWSCYPLMERKRYNPEKRNIVKIGKVMRPCPFVLKWSYISENGIMLCYVTQPSTQP